MQSIHRIIDDAPESIAIPQELWHRRIELIIHPLPDEAVAQLAELATTSDETAGQPSPSLYDLTKEFCGFIKGGPTDLSTNPKYMEGFGE